MSVVSPVYLADRGRVRPHNFVAGAIVVHVEPSAKGELGFQPVRGGVGVGCGVDERVAVDAIEAVLGRSGGVDQARTVVVTEASQGEGRGA